MWQSIIAFFNQKEGDPYKNPAEQQFDGGYLNYIFEISVNFFSLVIFK